MDPVELKIGMEIQVLNTEQNHHEKSGLNSPIVLSNLGQQILSVLNHQAAAAGSPAVSPGAGVGPHQRVAAAHRDSSGDPLPMPNPPPSGNSGGAPDPSVPSGSGTNEGADGYIDKLEQFFEYITNNPNDPSGPINLMAYLVNLSNAGLLDNPAVQSVLQGWNVNGLITSAMSQAVMEAFFYGYQNNAPGPDSMNAYIASVEGALGWGASKDPILNSMYNVMHYFDTDDFTKDHYKGTDLVWTVGGITYNWSNSQGDDKFFIEQLIGSGAGLSQNFYQNYLNSLNSTNGINSAERNYRLSALQELLAEYKNPEIVISLWIMMAYDQTFQGQEGGLANTTNLLTNVTNNYATPLLTDAQSIGPNMTSDQAVDFVKTLYNGTNLINILPQTSTIAGQWQNNVFDAIYNLPVPSAPSPGTLGSIMDAYLANPSSPGALDALTNALRGLDNPPAGSSPSTRPNYQTVINALTQGGALVTGTSKIVSTQLSTVANVDDQVVKLGSSMTSSTGGGFAQLMMQIVQNQISH